MSGLSLEMFESVRVPFQELSITPKLLVRSSVFWPLDRQKLLLILAFASFLRQSRAWAHGRP